MYFDLFRDKSRCRLYVGRFPMIFMDMHMKGPGQGNLFREDRNEIGEAALKEGR